MKWTSFILIFRVFLTSQSHSSPHLTGGRDFLRDTSSSSAPLIDQGSVFAQPCHEATNKGLSAVHCAAAASAAAAVY